LSDRPPVGGLPVEEVIGELRDALAHRGRAVLVAPPGAGKTTLGRQLARRLGKPFLDADRELEIARATRVGEA